MTKLPPRTNTDIAVSHLNSARMKLAKALPYILNLGHTTMATDLTNAITAVGELASRFNAPDSPPLTAVQQPTPSNQ